MTSFTKKSKLHVMNCDDAHEMLQKLEIIYKIKSDINIHFKKTLHCSKFCSNIY